MAALTVSEPLTDWLNISSKNFLVLKMFSTAGGLLRLLLCCGMMLGQIRDPVDAPTRCCLYLNCPARKNGTLDLLHANVREADTSTALPPLGKSDYNLFVLKPYYRPKIKRLWQTLILWRNGHLRPLQCWENPLTEPDNGTSRVSHRVPEHLYGYDGPNFNCALLPSQQALDY